MKNFKYLALTLVMTLLSFNAFSAEKEDAIAILNSQITLITKIKRFVDVQDLGRSSRERIL